MDYLEQNRATGRVVFPDLVRAFALFGIVLVNVAYLAWPGEMTYEAGGLTTSWDKAAYFGVNNLFLFKSYSLFSMMFGAGLAFQMMSAERKSLNIAPRYFRRILSLILLGILHVTLAFTGDILIIYGLLGAVLYLFRNARLRTLMRWGIGLIILQIISAGLTALGLYMGERFAPDEMATGLTEMEELMQSAFAVYGEGSFFQTVSERWADWVGYIAFASWFQIPGVLGFFLLGLALARSNLINEPAAALWAKARRQYLPSGLLISSLGAYLIYTAPHGLSSTYMAGLAAITIGAPFASIGYMGLIAKWAERPMTKLKLFFARGGTATLTAYLMQSLLLSLIFNGYGLGLYGKLGAAPCIAIALAVGILTISFSSLWRTRFSRGPMEVLLRRWTYLGAD